MVTYKNKYAECAPISDDIVSSAAFYTKKWKILKVNPGSDKNEMYTHDQSTATEFGTGKGSIGFIISGNHVILFIMFGSQTFELYIKMHYIFMINVLWFHLELALITTEINQRRLQMYE